MSLLHEARPSQLCALCKKVELGEDRYHNAGICEGCEESIDNQACTVLDRKAADPARVPAVTSESDDDFFEADSFGSLFELFGFGRE